jgi:5-enolpyruvylshikimate-3-phosphate synthase
MAFAVAGLRTGGVTVDDAGCVSKSNPRFWEQLEALSKRA